MRRTIAQRDRVIMPRIMAAVEARASFVVTRSREPIAELRPLARPRRQFVSKVEIAALAAEGSRIDAAPFRQDLETPIDQRLGQGDQGLVETRTLRTDAAGPATSR